MMLLRKQSTTVVWVLALNTLAVCILLLAVRLSTTTHDNVNEKEKSPDTPHRPTSNAFKIYSLKDLGSEVEQKFIDRYSLVESADVKVQIVDNTKKTFVIDGEEISFDIDAAPTELDSIHVMVTESSDKEFVFRSRRNRHVTVLLDSDDSLAEASKEFSDFFDEETGQFHDNGKVELVRIDTEPDFDFSSIFDLRSMSDQIEIFAEYSTLDVDGAKMQRFFMHEMGNEIDAADIFTRSLRATRTRPTQMSYQQYRQLQETTLCPNFRVFKLGLVVDSLLYQSMAPDTTLTTTERVANVKQKVQLIVTEVDSHFSKYPLCIQFQITEIQVWNDTTTDPNLVYNRDKNTVCSQGGLTTSFGDALKDGNYNIGPTGQSTSFVSDSDVVHLLYNEAISTGTIGCAYTGSACQNTITPTTTTLTNVGVCNFGASPVHDTYRRGLLLAHELGHSFGSPHNDLIVTTDGVEESGIMHGGGFCKPSCHERFFDTSITAMNNYLGYGFCTITTKDVSEFGYTMITAAPTISPTQAPTTASSPWVSIVKETLNGSTTFQIQGNSNWRSENVRVPGTQVLEFVHQDSSITSTPITVSPSGDDYKLTFYYQPRKLEGDDRLLVQYSTDGSTYTTIMTYQQNLPANPPSDIALLHPNANYYHETIYANGVTGGTVYFRIAAVLQDKDRMLLTDFNIYRRSETANPATSSTQSPTKRPTQSPTKSPTQSPTKSPTQSPTKSPTQSPTKSPTQSPTKSPTQSPTKSPNTNLSPADSSPWVNIANETLNGSTTFQIQGNSNWRSENVRVAGTQVLEFFNYDSSITSTPIAVSPSGDDFKLTFYYHPRKLEGDDRLLVQYSTDGSIYTTIMTYQQNLPANPPSNIALLQQNGNYYHETIDANGVTGGTVYFRIAVVLQDKDRLFLTDFNIYRKSQTANSPSPTTSPTQSPTKSPTQSPTKSPTQSPTHSPTNSPTQSPTNSPTNSPTQTPTQSPTNSPTESPTNSPTNSPTQTPTQSPTKSPTQSPTNSPTQSPTNSLTQSPTNSPAQGLTNSPTQSPTTSQWENVVSESLNGSTTFQLQGFYKYTDKNVRVAGTQVLEFVHQDSSITSTPIAVSPSGDDFKLTFYYQPRKLEGDDRLLVQYSTDGSTYTTIMTYQQNLPANPPSDIALLQPNANYYHETIYANGVTGGTVYFRIAAVLQDKDRMLLTDFNIYRKSQTPSPTKIPTQSPTKSPTQSPTKSPTQSPTKSPTQSPTKSPTQSPTNSPTNSPTQSPTNSPTKSPTTSQWENVVSESLNGSTTFQLQGFYKYTDKNVRLAGTQVLEFVHQDSSITSTPITVSPSGDDFKLTFYYQPRKLEGDDRLLVQYSTDGSTYTTIMTYQQNLPANPPSDIALLQPNANYYHETIYANGVTGGTVYFRIAVVLQDKDRMLLTDFNIYRKSQTPNPTTSPTQSPTTSPTQSPTKSPTQSPTNSPTNSPTQSPTNSPTKSPTTSQWENVVSESLNGSTTFQLQGFYKYTDKNVRLAGTQVLEFVHQDSSITSTPITVSPSGDDFKLTFYYQPRKLEGDDRLLVQYSTDGSTYTTIMTYQQNLPANPPSDIALLQPNANYYHETIYANGVTGGTVYFRIAVVLQDKDRMLLTDFNIYRKSEPTNPTTSPTQSPTTSPTQSPTKSPTQSPTTSPTQSPTTSQWENVVSESLNGSTTFQIQGFSNYRDDHVRVAGTQVLELANQDSSITSTAPIAVSPAGDEFDLTFWYYARKLEDDDRLLVQYSTDGSTFTTIMTYQRVLPADPPPDMAVLGPNGEYRYVTNYVKFFTGGNVYFRIAAILQDKDRLFLTDVNINRKI